MDKISDFEARYYFPAATGIVVTIPEYRWGRHGIQIALEVWWLRSKRWDLQAPTALGLKRSLADFESQKFVVAERTRKAFAGLSTQQKLPIMLVPVRCEVIASHEVPPLNDGEFDLDFASALWFMGTHWDSFLASRHQIEIACLGEEYADREQILTIGFKNGVRRVNLRKSENLSGCLRIIGILPEIEP